MGQIRGSVEAVQPAAHETGTGWSCAYPARPGCGGEQRHSGDRSCGAAAARAGTLWGERSLSRSEFGGVAHPPFDRHRLGPPPFPIGTNADQRRSKHAGLDVILDAIPTLASEALLRIAQCALAEGLALEAACPLAPRRVPGGRADPGMVGPGEVAAPAAGDAPRQRIGPPGGNEASLPLPCGWVRCRAASPPVAAVQGGSATLSSS